MPSDYYVDSASQSGADNNLTATILFKSFRGVEGMPYQFMDTTDNRFEVDNSGNRKSSVGRKFTEKIVTRMPLLFLTPCEPLFIDGNKGTDTQKVLFGALMNNDAGANLTSLISSKANGQRYYTAQFATYQYYNYLNFMLNMIVNYLGLGEEEIEIKGKMTKLANVAWQDELDIEFSNYFYKNTLGTMQSLFFYCDAIDSVSESFSNDTTQSSLASQVNGYSDQIKEIQFLLGNGGGMASSLLTNIQNELGNTNGDGNWMSSLGESFVGLLTNSIGGENSLINKWVTDSTLAAVAAGGKIIFPEIWSDSQYSKSYSIDIKLRSPDHDSLSIFLNVLKPYCKLLALTMPRAFRGIDGNDIDPNGYGSPFLVKAACKGLFNIDMGIITSLSVTKGASCAWNDDGLPTQIDVSLEIKDLYSTLAMSGYGNMSIDIFSNFSNILDATKNAVYLDFLANMAGLNVNEMLPMTSLKNEYYGLKGYVNTALSTASTRFDQWVANTVSKMRWLK